MTETLSNSASDLKRRVDRRVDVLGQISDLAAELKQFKAEDKDDGYTEKAIGRIVKEAMADADYRFASLTLEAEIDTYRRAYGLPTELDEAAGQSREEAEAVPAPKRRGRKGEDE